MLPVQERGCGLPRAELQKTSAFWLKMLYGKASQESYNNLEETLQGPWDKLAAGVEGSSTNSMEWNWPLVEMEREWFHAGAIRRGKETVGEWKLIQCGGEVILMRSSWDIMGEMFGQHAMVE